MSGAEIGLALSVFLACMVEALEALTIVLAVGTTRGWAGAMGGVGAATFLLAMIVAVFGAALTNRPIDVLRAGVSGLLLIFGLQWLRKAILRAARLKARHDERQAYRREVDAAEFVVGDDWRTAVGVVLTLTLTGVLAETTGSAWWVMLLAVIGLLARLVRDVAQSASRAQSGRAA